MTDFAFAEGRDVGEEAASASEARRWSRVSPPNPIPPMRMAVRREIVTSCGFPWADTICLFCSPFEGRIKQKPFGQVSEAMRSATIEGGGRRSARKTARHEEIPAPNL